MTGVRSTAGRVLAKGRATPEEAKALAGAVLGDDSLTPAPSDQPISGDDSGMERTAEDLRRLLAKIDGKEGQTERAAMIRRQLEAMGE